MDELPQSSTAGTPAVSAGTGVKARSRGDHGLDVRQDEERRRSCGAAGRRLRVISSGTLKKTKKSVKEIFRIKVLNDDVREKNYRPICSSSLFYRASLQVVARYLVNDLKGNDMNVFTPPRQIK